MHILSVFDLLTLSRNKSQTFDVIVGGESTFAIDRKVAEQSSAYFATALNGRFAEAKDGIIRVDDVEPQYFDLFVRSLYSFSSGLPIVAPRPTNTPQSGPRKPMREYVEIYKLCDRFLCKRMADFMHDCLCTSISERHRMLFKWQENHTEQCELAEDFADAYEALDLGHPTQQILGERMIKYFTGGMSLSKWPDVSLSLQHHTEFIRQVSCLMATTLDFIYLTRSRRGRKELPTLKHKNDSPSP